MKKVMVYLWCIVMSVQACSYLLPPASLKDPEVRSGAGSTITNVIITSTDTTMDAGAFMQLTARVDGTGNYDPLVDWTLSEVRAGTITDTGLFIANPDYSGTVTVRASGRPNSEYSDTHDILILTGPRVVYVYGEHSGGDGSIDNPFSSINAALAALPDGGVINAAIGIYEEDIILPSAKTVRLYGGFSPVFDDRDPQTYPTKINGGGSTAVITMNFDGDSSVICRPVIDGFSISGGNRGINIVDTAMGGDVYVTIANNLIEDNSGLSGHNDFGGGIYLENTIPVIENNIIRNNRCGKAGGVYVVAYQPYKILIMKNNIIDGNTALTGKGGGIGLALHQASISHNIIKNNETTNLIAPGGGITISGLNYASYDDTLYVELSYNTYYNNSTFNCGGAVYLTSSANVRMHHELIYNNHSAYNEFSGAGIYLFCEHLGDAKLTIDHCTIAYNSGTENVPGHALAMSVGSRVEISNSIFYRNGGVANSDFYMDGSSTLSLNYSCWQGNGTIYGTLTELHNITDEPMFANPAQGDYHLRSEAGRYDPVSALWVYDTRTSPCIDTADPAADYSLETVPNGTRANMGVYGNTVEASRSGQ